MMIESVTEENPFQAVLQKLTDQVVLDKFKTKAWDHFLEIGLPTPKSEVFRYVKMRLLYGQDFTLPGTVTINAAQIEPFIYPECAESVLVFVNGTFTPLLSRMAKLPRKMVISPISEALKTYGALLTNHWTKSLKEETDPFASLNYVLHQDGAFVYLPPKTICEAPIQILHLIEGEGIAVCPRLHVFVGAQSEVQFVSRKEVLGKGRSWINQVTDFALEDDSHVRYMQIDDNGNQWNMEAVRATVKRNCTFKTVSVTDGGEGVRGDYKVVLNGENSEASLSGVWMLDGNREAHCHVLMDHQAPHCRSMQMFKGANNAFGRSSFEGKILVRQEAQKTDAFQLNNNLLLSERAMAYSKPNLEIFADDVKASHGSTVGQIDAEQIFYLRTRGVSEAEAKNILVYGYCKEVIDLIPIPSVLEEVSERAKHFVTKV